MQKRGVLRRPLRLAIALLDWKVYGRAYAAAMIEMAQALAAALTNEGLPVYAAERGATVSHQFGVQATRFGGGQSMAKRLRRANILARGIGLPIAAVEGDMNGLRLGTPEIVRWGFTAGDMPVVAGVIARARASDAAADALAGEVAAFRGARRTLRCVR